MKASAFSDAQEAFILKQGADGVPVAEVCRRAGISQATYFNWKKKYDGLLPLHPLLAGDRSGVHLSVGECRRCAGSGLRQARLSKGDPGRLGDRVRLPEPGPMGLRPWRNAGLLPARQADGQRLHRSLQRPLPGRVPERPLVPDTLRMQPKSWRLGAETTTRSGPMGP